MEIRYAVAGKPIQHSLSPVLAVLTATHLKQAGLEVEFEEINLLESDDVTSPMAWAWVKKNRQSIDLSNRLYGDPSTPSSHSKLRRVASAVMSLRSSLSKHLKVVVRTLRKSKNTQGQQSAARSVKNSDIVLFYQITNSGSIQVGNLV